MNKFLEYVADVFFYVFRSIFPLAIFMAVGGSVSLAVFFLFDSFFDLPNFFASILASLFGLFFTCMIFRANCFGKK